MKVIMYFVIQKNKKIIIYRLFENNCIIHLVSSNAKAAQIIKNIIFSKNAVL